MDESELQEQLLGLYEEWPFHRHPLWIAILRGELSIDQLASAETQHWIRTKRGQQIRRNAVTQADLISETVYAAVVETYFEECVTTAGNTSHLELVERLLEALNVDVSMRERAEPTPGNVAAITLYEDIADRGAACHILGAGAVEHYYSQLAPQVFDAYTTKYGIQYDPAAV